MKKFLKKIKFELKKNFLKFEYFKYKKRCKKRKQKEFLIFNTPIHGNLGDHAIIFAENKILKELNIEAFEISTYEELYIFECIKNNVSQDATISITGGGFLGSQWTKEMDLINKVVKTFKKHKIIIFPQTIFFKEGEFGKKELEKSVKIFDEAKNLFLFVREEKSYQLAKKLYLNAKIFLVPDIVLCLNVKLEFKREGALLCLRKDVEGILNEEQKENLNKILKRYFEDIKYTDTVLENRVSKKEREIQIFKKLEEFSKSKLVITDRLHGMIFATITNTPCIALSNYNYKIKGVYDWIKDKNIVFEEDIKNITKDIEKLLQYENKNIEKNLYNFDKLKEILEA